jgi:hypothetical protein
MTFAVISEQPMDIMRFEVFMAVNNNIMIFWEVTPCIIVDRYTTSVLEELQQVLQNGTYLSDYTASHPRGRKLINGYYYNHY